ncbi:hypothetical protein [Microbispora sp. H10830]|uniref:hypothetical protein n=1 Tax=Microbispora sp. H10830 TaxID=2729109 RepID=UPI001600C4D9|nr:hypothetical protein [Microbispora sp. H10830]
MRRSAFLRRLGTAGVLLAGLLLAVPAQQTTAQAAVTATPTPSAAATANPYVTASDMKVTPSTYTGSCQVGPYGLEHIVSATITVSKPMTVNYSWMADYGFWTAGSVTFDAPGSKTVINAFYRTTSLKGTMRLKLADELGGAETEAASFDTVCTEPEVIASQMQVTPAAYTGPCNETQSGLAHEVSAKITVSAPTTVKYVWINPENQPWPDPNPVSVTFDAPGTKTVSNVFFRTTSLRGTMRLRIVEPAGVADTQAASFDTVCVKPTVSDISKQRTDENEVCGPGAPAELTLTAKLAVADGPSTVDYRWYRKSNQTRNQWVYLGAGSAVFTSTGAQEKTITTRYSTSVSENGYFKVELSSPYQGLGQSAFLVSCSTKNDL